MPVRLAMVCEAEADFRTASRLAERVFVESIDWVEDDLLSSCPIWVESSKERSFLLWREVKDLAKEYGIKAHGHFADLPAEPDAQAARRALLVLKYKHQNQPIQGIVLVRDDGRDTRRRQGLEQARQQSEMCERIVIGLAHCKRECWVLAGFDPADDSETERLRAVSGELGFDPSEKAHELTAKGDGDKRSAKRIVTILLGGNHERESLCIDQTELDKLRSRGLETGLNDYLLEIQERLVPVFGLKGPGGP
jgi:hypothetical protein